MRLEQSIYKTLLTATLALVGVAAMAQNSTAEVTPLATKSDSVAYRNQMRERRGLSDIKSVFVPKHQWVFGAMASYSTHVNNSYDLLLIEGIESHGYTVKVSPLVAYAIADNMALGVRATYGRSLLKMDSASLSFGEDINISAKDFYSLNHNYSVSAIWRYYIPLGANRRFALFNEMLLSVGGSQAKFASDSPVKGTYQTGYNLGLGLSPGIVAFATNNIAFEVNVGVMGINYSKVKQVHNQVSVGERESSNMNFKVNLLSIGLGVAFYL